MSVSREDTLGINQKGWNVVAPLFHAGTALPKYGPLAGTEDELQLLGDLKGKTVLELGCGSGHTLEYLWKVKQAGELWALDLSQEQLRFTRELLTQENIPATLFLSSMDENLGIPQAHFDLVVAIYSLGWTPDLPTTLSLVYSYLKPGGKFVFSWEHPVYRCLDYDANNQKFFFRHSYLNETTEIKPSWKGVEIVIPTHKLSTYINALSQAGFIVEHMIESDVNLELAREQDHDPEKWYSVPRAELIPTTFIVQATKPIHK